MAAGNSYDSRDANSSQSSLTSLEVRFAKSPLSGTRRLLIRAILDNHEETFFLSSREMAKRYNVDAATIVRTVQALGYERFADFAADLRQHFVNHITPYTVLKAATQEKRSVTDQVQHCLERDVESLSVLRSSLEANRLVELARRIHGAHRILVVGVDLAASLAWFLAYGLACVSINRENNASNTLGGRISLFAFSLLELVALARYFSSFDLSKLLAWVYLLVMVVGVVVNAHGLFSRQRE